MAIAQTERRDLDSIILENGQSPFSVLPPDVVAVRRKLVSEQGYRLHSAATSDLVRYSRESSFSRLGETPPYPASGQHLRQPVEEPDPKLDRRCFIVRDADGQALACVYFENEPGRRPAAHLLTRDEARRIAALTIKR